MSMRAHGSGLVDIMDAPRLSRVRFVLRTKIASN
jgi:hypothetical protein